MWASQYSITLPADYDMGVIRKRVENAAHTFDGRAGLELKAFLIREKGVNDSPVNEYAPFYLWRDADAMAQFLVGGGGFQGIIRDFGRQTVETFVGIASREADGSVSEMPRAASRRITHVEPDSEPAGLGLMHRMAREVTELDVLATRPEVHSAALALDPTTWRLVQFVLWHAVVPKGEDVTERYEVLHISKEEKQ